MKKLIIILFVFASFVSNGQNLKGFNVTAFDTLKTEKLLKFNSEPILGGFTEYSMQVDTANRTVTMTNDETEIAMQLGQELWLEIKNGNGVTYLNGALVYIVEGTGEHPTIMLADNRDFETVDAVGMITHDVEAGTFGFTTVYGNVGGLNTLGTTTGQKVYVDTIGGSRNWTTTLPAFSAYEFEVGHITKVDEFDGKIFINPKGQVDDILHNISNASLNLPFDFRTEVVGNNVVGTLSSPTGDTTITIRWSDGFQKIVVPQSVNIPQGTDNASQFSVAYLEKSTGLLATSTTYFPLDSQIKTIAKLETWTAAKTLQFGEKGNQNYNDQTANINTGVGWRASVGKWQRLQPLKFVPESGSVGSMAIQNVSGLDSVKFALTQGVWSQANEQLQPAYDMALGDDIHVWNWPGHADTTITNLANVLIDANGNSLTGKSWVWEFWLVQNKTGEPFHVFLNLPTGSYNSSASAISDALGTKVKSIPYRMQSYSGFLYEAVMTHTNPGGGTWTLNQLKDTKGDYPFGGGSSGSQGGILAYFTDLLDTPNSYVGEGSKLLQVDPLESAVSFIAKSAIPLTDLDSTNFKLEIPQIVGLGDSLDLKWNNDGSSDATGDWDIGAYGFSANELYVNGDAMDWRVSAFESPNRLIIRNLLTPFNEITIDGDNHRTGFGNTVPQATIDVAGDGILSGKLSHAAPTLSTESALLSDVESVENQLANYVTLGTSQTITGTKTFESNIELNAPLATSRIIRFEIDGVSTYFMGRLGGTDDITFRNAASQNVFRLNQDKTIDVFDDLNVSGVIDLTSGTLGGEAMDRDDIEALITGGTEDADFLSTTVGILKDKDGDAGTSGQVLSSTVTGTDWITNSLSLGTNGQIPYMNANGDDFVYDSDLTFNGTKLSVSDIDVGSFINLNGSVGRISMAYQMMKEGTSVPLPNTGNATMAVKTDGLLYFRNDNSQTFELTNASGYAKNSDPLAISNGYIIWQSDGSGSGDNGDIMIKVNDGTTTKTKTLVDFSAL